MARYGPVRHLMSSDLSLPNSSLFANLLQSCIESKSLRDGRRVHARLIKTQFSSETFIQNRLIDVYAKCGCFEDARKVFDRIGERNTFTWNTMISAVMKLGFVDEAVSLFQQMPCPDQCSWNSMVSGFAQHDGFEEALGCFTRMHAEDFVIDMYALSSALSACAGLTDFRTGTQIHALILKSSFSSDVYMGSALIDMYSKCGHPFSAQRIFDGMPVRNVVSWNSLITCYEQNSPVGEALKLFRRMMECGFKPDEVTLASVVSACASLSAIEEGLQIHACTIKSDRFRDDLVLCNAFVDMYAKCSRIKEARWVFDRMLTRNVITETSMLSGYAKAANVKTAHSMFTMMAERNVVSWNALIAGYAQNEETEEALELFRKLKKESIWPTPYTFGNVLSACAKHADLQLGKQSDIFVGNSLVDMYAKCGSIEDGCRVFDKMVDRDKVSWNAMIVGYAQNGNANEALKLFNHMIMSEQKPDNVTMVGVLSACSHAGRLDEAEKVIESMPIQPDSVLWGSLLSACKVHGNMKLGKRVADKLLELDPKNSGSYVLLSNMYAETGRWGEVVRIRKLMRQRGVVKQPGCSWIELQSQVHVFLVKDKRHPCRKEIYHLLKMLIIQMRRAGYVPDVRSISLEADTETELENPSIQSEYESDMLAVAEGL
ncbi:hypothetical protein ACLOJK_016788 [Asimina triloba]